MNNLQKLAKKKAKKKDKEELLAKLKGAFHEAAEEGDKVLKKSDKMKTANPAKVKALMAKGMGAKEAIKAAYPDWSDEQVAALAAKMSGDGGEKTAGRGKIMAGTLAGGALTGGALGLAIHRFGKKKKKEGRQEVQVKAASSNKTTFSPAMDKSPALKGKQSKLPDHIQAKILAKKAKGPVSKEASAEEAMVAAGQMLAKTSGARLTALREGAELFGKRLVGKNQKAAKEALEVAKSKRPVHRPRKKPKANKDAAERLERYNKKSVAPKEADHAAEISKTRKARLQAGLGLGALTAAGVAKKATS